MYLEKLQQELRKLKKDDQSERDEILYRHTKDFIIEINAVSVSKIQRAFQLGYNKAERLIKRMEADGLVTPPSHSGSRKLL